MLIPKLKTYSPNSDDMLSAESDCEHVSVTLQSSHSVCEESVAHIMDACITKATTKLSLKSILIICSPFFRKFVY